MKTKTWITVLNKLKAVASESGSFGRVKRDISSKWIITLHLGQDGSVYVALLGGLRENIECDFHISNSSTHKQAKVCKAKLPNITIDPARI